MKTRALFPVEINRFLVWWAVAVVCVTCDAQLTQTVPVAASGESDYAITQVGPHSRLWRNSAGQTVTEIATGMNYWDGQQWTPSDNSFAISPDGTSFVADKIQDPTQIAANINQQGAVTAVTPEGVTLRSTPTAIVLYDAASGLSAIVGTITNSIGVQVDAQHVVYTNAFSSSLFSASIVYSLPDTGSFHQDVIFTGFDTNFDPTAFGFAAEAANTLQIEVMTEFYNPPQPMAQERDLYIEQDPNMRTRMVSPDLIDYTLDFGHYVLGPGRAYTTSSTPGAGAGVVVTKDFVTTNGRSFLIESTSYKSIAGYLNSLPAPKPTASLNPPPSARKRMVAWEGIPSLKKNATKAKAMKVAGLTPRGLDIDYIATVSSTVEPKLYSSDTTYFVSGNVYESSAVTMESAVFKYPTSSGRIEIASTLTLATTNYRTAIFTSADDPTAGATLSTNIWSGYTGTPTSHRYGSQALSLNTSANITLNNLRFCYMNIAVQINADTAGQKLTMWHSQLVDCYEGVYVDGGNGSNTNASLTFNLYNCLFADVGTLFEIGGIVITGNAYNCTDDSSTDLVTVDSGTTVTGNVRFTNSIFSTLASKGTLGSLSLGGGSNVFYNCGSATFGTFNTLLSSPYVTNGAGYFYITNYISYLTNGSTAVPPALQSQLEMKTTQAPYFISSIPFSTILTPIIPRDLSGVALRWHYDPIDFMFNNLQIPTNTTLVLTNGVALAYIGVHGIVAEDGSALYSQGTPNQRNYLAYFNLVQEQPLPLSVFSLSLTSPIFLDPTNTAPSVTLRLTTICAPTGATTLLNTGPNLTFASLIMRDCEVYGSGGIWQMTDTNSNPAPTMQLINNVFYRVPFAITNAATNIVFNNLFYGTTNYITNISVSGTITTNTSTLVSIQHSGGSSPNTNQNNVYDGVNAAIDGSTGHNAYLHGAVATLGGESSDITNSSLAWEGGPLGAYYQQSGGPLWENGSESAANLGLYHYTVLTNEAIEGSSTVSRGYHYVALTNTTGLPLDYNNDGVPDYLEDANGDGSTDNGETNWMSHTPAWIGTSPFNQNALVGASATFSVTAYGTAPLSYQWYSNGVSLGSGATSSSYTISSVTTSDAATNYYVTAANSYGSATSSSATLTIVTAPFFYSTYPPFTGQFWFQPTWNYLISLIGVYGSVTPIYYSQYLSQYLPYISSYQWQLNGVNIAGASGSAVPATYYIATNDGGTNTLIVTNVAGTSSLSWTNILQATPGMVETWGNNAEGQCSRPLWPTNTAGIAAGVYQSIAMTDTNSIVQWGAYGNSSGGTFSVTNYVAASPPPQSNVVAVAAGQVQGLALLANSTVYSWGLLTNGFGWNVTNQPNLTNVTAIACGTTFDMALSNGTVVAWGNASDGDISVPSYLSNVVAIAASGYHGMALRSNGMVVTWGTVSGNLTNPPPLTNPVAIATGYAHFLALQSNGMVVAWGDNTYGQCAIPAAASNGNVMAIAAGDYHSAALLNNGTIVEWGENTYGQTNVPQSNPTNPVVVKLLAAAGNHTMAGIFSSWVQYPVNVFTDLLLIYNSNSIDSWNVCQYYLTHRPMVSSANVLGIGCTNGEIVDSTDFANTVIAPIQDWLNINPTKRPAYVILFQDIPSRVENGATYLDSVQYNINSLCAAGWQPFVSSINMNGTGGTNDCTAYISKLASVASTNPTGQVIISASAGLYGNSNWYFDDTETNYSGDPLGYTGAHAVLQDGFLSSCIFYTNVNPECINLQCHITSATNVAGYFSWGSHSVGLGTNYATNELLNWHGNSGWYLIQTVESFNGQRVPAFPQGNFLSWFASDAFGATNYSNTPVGGVSNVEEPQLVGINDPAIYFGLWGSGKNFGLCAWNSRNTQFFQAVGDPLVKR